MTPFETYGLIVLRSIAFVGLSVLTLKRASYAIWLILMMYFLFPLDMTPSSILSTTNSNVLFYTRWIGLNGIELVMLWTVLLLAVRTRFIAQGPFRIRFIPNKWLHIYFLILLLAFMNGILRSVFQEYAGTPFRSPFGYVSVLAYIYFMMTLVYNVLDSEEEIKLFIRNFWRLIIAALCWGCIRFTLYQFGVVDAIAYAGKIPITLYQTTLLFYPAVCVYLLVKWSDIPQAVGPKKIVFLLMIFFLLITTRRLTYVLVIGTVCAGYISARLTGHVVPSSWSKRIWGVVKFAGICIGLYIIIPVPFEVKAIFWKVWLSINIWSESFGYLASGAERVAQLQNLFENLRIGNGYLFGMGIGTYWQEIIPVPHSPYTVGRLVEQNVTAHGAFVLPLINWLYRFGIVGSILLWICVIQFYRSHIQYWRHDQRTELAVYAISFLVYSCAFLVLIGDSRNSGTVVLGTYIGLIEAMRYCWKTDDDFSSIPD